MRPLARMLGRILPKVNRDAQRRKWELSQLGVLRFGCLEWGCRDRRPSRGNAGKAALVIHTAASNVHLPST